MRKKNPNASGAVIERTLIVRYLRRKLGQEKSTYDAYPHSWRLLATDLLAWLEKQPARTKGAGGIGR